MSATSPSSSAACPQLTTTKRQQLAEALRAIAGSGAEPNKAPASFNSKGSQAVCPFSGHALGKGSDKNKSGSISSRKMTCPFSGVTFDKATIDRILQQTQNGDDSSLGSENDDPEIQAEEEDSYGENDIAQQQQQQQQQPQTQYPIKTSLKVQIINQTSGRSKDLLVDISADLTLYDSIYDAKSVKEAHVRKWTSELARKVKSNCSEIRCVVYDDAVATKPWRTLRVEELKTITTRQLFEQVSVSSTVIRMVLECVPIKVGANVNE